MNLIEFITSIKNFCAQFNTVSDFLVKVKIDDVLIDVVSIEYDYTNKTVIVTTNKPN